jgi:sec-independent protein translocase protein TatA
MLEGLFRPAHMLAILVIALLLFGPKRLPELGKSLGAGIKSFRRSVSGKDDEPATPQK